PPHLALVAIATTRAPRKARRLALHPDSASARRIPLALPARCSRRIYFRMPSWGSWASGVLADCLQTGPGAVTGEPGSRWGAGSRSRPDPLLPVQGHRDAVENVDPGTPVGAQPG